MWELMKVRAVLVGLLLLLNGCSARYHLDKAIRKDPKILDSVTMRIDTLIITEKQALTDTLILQRVDTIKIIREGIRIDVRRSYDTIEVNVECPSDTIRISKEIKVPQIIYQEKEFNSKYLLYLIISIILYTFGLLKYTK